MLLPRVTKLLLTLCFFLSLTSSCNLDQGNTKTDFAKNDAHSIDLSDRIFLLGPSIDSTSGKIKANCDCCTSDLALLSNHLFVFISNCVDGDTYTKGQYSVKGKELLLKFDSISITQSFGFVADTAYETTEVTPRNLIIKLGALGPKLLLVSDQNGRVEYGIEEGTEHQQSVLNKLNINKIKEILK